MSEELETNTMVVGSDQAEDIVDMFYGYTEEEHLEIEYVQMQA
jgi:hypothetical protein